MRLDIPDAQVAELYRHAERAFMRPKALLAQIIAEWIKKPSMEFSAVRTLDGCTVTPSQMKVVLIRERIVNDWRGLRSVKRPQTLTSKLCADFLEKLQRKHGVAISRATLFNWDARYRMHGRAGLIDMRSVHASIIDKRYHRKSIKRPSKRGHNTARH